MIRTLGICATIVAGAALFCPAPVHAQSEPRITISTVMRDTATGLLALGADSVSVIFAPRVRVRPPPPVRIAGGGVRPMAVAKWGSLLSTAGTAVYGFAASMAADDHYARIEDACAEDVARCRISETDGRYLDPEIEEWDRQAERLDRRARVGLIASQVGVAASIVLFILDLRDTGAPPNVPYQPSRVQVGLSAIGVRLGVRLPVP